MQKWEYLFVDANMYPFGNKLISLYVNSEEKRDWKQKILHLFVNELGEDGWELVALRHDSKYDQNCLIFKRPKVEILPLIEMIPMVEMIPEVIPAVEMIPEVIPAVEMIPEMFPAVETATTQTKSTSVDY